MYEHAASFTCYELWRGADIRYLSEWSEDRSLGESQRSFCQCHLSSRLGTKEVGASVPLPPSCAPLNLHNKVPCYIRGESRTPRANGGILCQTEASLNPQWGDGRTHLPFPGESRLASAPLPPHKVPPPSLPLSLSLSLSLYLSPCFFCLLLCSVSLSFLIPLRLYTHSPAHSLWHAFLSKVAQAPTDTQTYANNTHGRQTPASFLWGAFLLNLFACHQVKHVLLCCIPTVAYSQTYDNMRVWKSKLFRLTEMFASYFHCN